MATGPRDRLDEVHEGPQGFVSAPLAPLSLPTIVEPREQKEFAKYSIYGAYWYFSLASRFNLSMRLYRCVGREVAFEIRYGYLDAI